MRPAGDTARWLSAKVPTSMATVTFPCFFIFFYFIMRAGHHHIDVATSCAITYITFPSATGWRDGISTGLRICLSLYHDLGCLWMEERGMKTGSVELGVMITG